MKTVVITGASRGIGAQLARLYAQEGARVIGGVRTIGAAPQGVELRVLDVAEPASTSAFAKGLAGEAVDILINNAGVIGPHSSTTLEPMDFEAFAQCLAVNTLGPLRVSQALLGSLRAARGAKLAIISSQMGASDYASSSDIAYQASKAAVNKLAIGLARDLKREGIAVAAIHPGWVRTDMGGPGAHLDPVESAMGVKAVIDGLDIGSTGRFWNWDGADRTW
ncbi:MAG TPA: SDR family oxidoreductase [Caulobacteraceae bacterium]|jgi:NAD(P)-dependent dehydrogenase (short-subunit alcohol dehydrogenase family)|nr:SDR family oxidoreductase [Caulobacteraceae bacterium]